MPCGMRGGRMIGKALRSGVTASHGVPLCEKERIRSRGIGDVEDSLFHRADVVTRPVDDVFRQGVIAAEDARAHQRGESRAGDHRRVDFAHARVEEEERGGASDDKVGDGGTAEIFTLADQVEHRGDTARVVGEDFSFPRNGD